MQAKKVPGERPMGAERTGRREEGFSLRGRHVTGERRRSHALDAARQLGNATASVVALGAVSDAVLIADRRGVVVFANPAWHALTGHPTNARHVIDEPSDQSLVGCAVRDLVEPASAVRDIVLALRREPSWRGPLGLRNATGRVIPVDLTVTPSIEVEPHASHFVLVARRHDSAMRTPARVVDTAARLASELAHDFNNQISVVLNYTFILLRQLASDSPLREHVPAMQAAAWRASQVAQELLAFGGPRLTEPEVLELPSVLANLEQLLRHTQDARIEIDLRLSPVLWRVRARLTHLEWLLLELALHAQRTLGHVERWSVEADNEEPAALERHVIVRVRAMPATHADAWSRNARGQALAGRGLPESPNDMPGAQLTLTHLRATLSHTRDEDGHIAYALRLPADRQAGDPPR